MKQTTMLEIAKGFSLPVDIATATIAYLAKRRSGKTYTASVVAEEMIRAGIQVVVIDPLGVWWGLRAGADGDPRGGLPIVIVGGDHADIPLDPEEGIAIADLVIEEGLSVILDTSGLSRPEFYTFCAAFLQRLFEKNRTALHVFVDEADMLAPQKTNGSGQNATLAALDQCVRRGGARGLGTSVITQRPAVLSKDILTQSDIIICLRVTGPQDRDAIDEWIKGNGTAAERKIVMDSLATMGIGEAFIWAPNYSEVLQRVQIRLRHTFDASATPKVGERVKAPRALADINLASIADQFAAKIKEAEASDPARMRARIEDLERQLRERPTETRVERVVEKIEVIKEVLAFQPGDLDKIAELQRAMIETADMYAAMAKDVKNEAGRLGVLLSKISPLATADISNIRGDITSDSTLKSEPIQVPSVPVDESPARPPISSPVSAQQRRSTPTISTPRATPIIGGGGLSGPQQKILDVLAEFAAIGIEVPLRSNVAVWADASPKSSSFANNLGTLRGKGLVEYPNGQTVGLSSAGREQAKPASKPVTKSDLLDKWVARLSDPQGRILRELVRAYPHAMRRIDVANATGASPVSSSFANNLGTLRSFGLADYPDGKTVVATALLFPEGLK